VWKIERLSPRALVNSINARKAIFAALQLDGFFKANKIFRGRLIAPADFAAIVVAAGSQ
jgi:hypothetical protein